MAGAEQPLTLHCPGSKSMTQRALLIAALAEAPVQLDGALECDDSRHLTALLRELGVRIEWEGARVRVDPPAELRSTGQPLYVGNAGTAMRFASCLALVVDGALQLDGDARMRERPIGPLVGALAQLGVQARYLGREGCPPVVLQRGAAAIGTRVTIDASQSSQYASGLLLVGPRLPAGLELTLSGPAVSLPYLQMTAEMMRRAGADVRWISSGRLLVGRQPYRTTHVAVEPDWSTAAFLLAAGELLRRPLHIPGLVDIAHSLQGDAIFVELLEELRRPQPHHIDLAPTPDLIAPLAALASFASHPTTITGVAHARIKESDRIAVLCQQLARAGIEVTERLDGLVIHPWRGAAHAPVTLEPANDHRMAMAFGLLSLRLEHITVAEPDCVAKSFPQFWDVLAQLRGA
ncbi:MAG: 3-phosphoshikimate 1-carboxyvinyltransferase [Proteobacteria bacterium]|nr:3-phosphoshikimate 1-carboxyvinyltransferase [Pseudomonadota bacterium]